MNPSDADPIIDLIEAFRRSRAMFAAVQLGIFDHLERTPADASALSASCGARTEPLERLLDACVGLGLLRKDKGVYRNQAAASTYLCRDSDHTLAGYVLYSSKVLFPLWAHLEDAICEGTPRWTQTFGGEGGIFDHFFRTEEAMRTFNRGMHGFGLVSSPAVVSAFDLSSFRRLVDLGGGTGHLALAACERYPQLRALVFDLPNVAEMAREEMAKVPWAAKRIELARGDFFEDELPEGDLFALSRILHDWNDDKALRLLKRICQRLPSGGGLLLAEKLLSDDKTQPVSATMQSLNMLVCTEGRERSLAEFRALLEAAGFTDVQGQITGRYLDAVLARKGIS